MKRVFLIGLAAAAAGSYAQIAIVPGAADASNAALRIYGSAAPALNFANIDAFITGNGTSPGTTVTVANMATATKGTVGGWTVSNSPPMVFGASVSGLPGSVTVIGDATYPASTSTQSFRYDHSTGGGSYVDMGIPGAHPVCSVAGWVTIAAPAGGFNLYDDLSLYDTGGHYADFQINNGSPYFASIESDGSGTLHSAHITAITPPQRVWMSLWMSSTPVTDAACSPGPSCPLAKMNLYSAGPGSTIGALIGSTVKVQLNPAQANCFYSRFGNIEFATSATTEIFEDLLYQWTSPVFPLLPQ